MLYLLIWLVLDKDLRILVKEWYCLVGKNGTSCSDAHDITLFRNKAQSPCRGPFLVHSGNSVIFLDLYDLLLSDAINSHPQKGGPVIFRRLGDH